MIKLGEVVMILDLHRQGLSVSAIALQLGIDRKTVRKYLERGLEAPVYGPRQPRPRRIDPFVPYLRERVEAACHEGNTSIHASGSSPGFITEAFLLPLLSLQRRLDLLTIDEFADCVDTCSEDMLLNIMRFGSAPQDFAAMEFTERDTVFGLAAEGKLRPAIARSYALADFQAAMADAAAGKSAGRIVLTMD